MMVTQKELDRLFMQMLAQCKTKDRAIRARRLIDELWQKGANHYQRHDQVLHRLVCNIRERQDANWSCAVLHLAMYPKLASIRRELPQYTWSEIHSALDQAIYDFKLSRVSGVAGCLSWLALYRLGAENRETEAEEALSETLSEVTKSFTMAQVLSGEPGQQFTFEEAQQALEHFQVLGLVEEKDIPHLLERFFPEDRNHDANERQKQTRAVKRFKKKVTKTKGPL